MDEPDQTFVNDAQMALWLERAYDDFRTIVIDIDPTIYSRSQTYSLSNARVLDLNGTILGPAAANRMYQLMDIYEVDATATPNVVRRRLLPSASAQSTYDFRAGYTLKGTELIFPGEVTMDIRIDYVPEPGVDWLLGVNIGTNIYVDDLGRFHDLIALLAYLQYAIVDAADSPQLIALLGRRQEQLRTYLENRSGGIVERVVDVQWM